MTNITVELTDAEFKALSYVAVNPQEWVENAVKERCRAAIEEIFQNEVRRMLDDPSTTEIPADRNAVVMAAQIKTAAERNAELSPSIGGIE